MKRLYFIFATSIIALSWFVPSVMKPQIVSPVVSGCTSFVSPINSNLVGYWPMNEGSGSSLTDYSGNGNSGIWGGTQTGTSGYYSPGFFQVWSGTFDGSTDNVQLANISAITSQSLLTVTAWFNSSSLTGSHTIICKPHNGPVWSSPFVAFMIRTTSATVLETDVGNGTTYSAKNNTVALLVNTWYFVAITYNGTTMTAYLNGNSIGTSTTVSGNLDSSVKPIIIGADYAGSPLGDYFSGTIQNVRIYNASLSGANIKTLYNGGNP